MNKEFKVGATVYCEIGQAAEYVARITEGHIVRPIVLASYGDEDEYEHKCDPVTWRAVFAQPPLAKFSDELKTLHEQIAAARQVATGEMNADAARQRERAAKLKRFAVLDNLELFIDGKITHYVDAGSDYSPPDITAIADAKSCDGDRYRHTLRLLTLGGSIKDGNIYWELSQYSDGSGSGRGVQPCTSYEQAAEIAKTAILRHFARGCNDPRQAWADAADKFGIAVPEQYRRAVAQVQIQNLERNLNYTRSQAASSAEALLKAEGELAQLRAYLTTPAGAA